MTLTRYLGDQSTLRIPMQWMRSPFVPAGEYFLLWTLKDELNDPDEYSKVQKTSGLGITEVGSDALVALERIDTLDLEPGVYIMDIVAQHTINTDDVRHVASGELHLHRPVSQKVQSSIPIQTTTPPVDYARLTVDQMKQMFVPYTEAIALTVEQKTQAKENIGLDQVENTSDIDKPVSTAQQAADTAAQIAAQTTAIAKAELLAGRTAKPAGMARMITIAGSNTDPLLIEITATTGSGYFAVRWWDGSVTIAGSGFAASKNLSFGGSWSRSAPKEIYVWACEGATNAVQSSSAMLSLSCSNLELATLDVSGLSFLTDLDCSFNPKLSSLDLTGCDLLETLDCSSTGIPSLDVSGFTALTSVTCSSNPDMASLNVSGCTSLLTLNCASSGLNDLNFTGCTSLQTLTCNGTSLPSLDVTGLPALQTLTCFAGIMTSLDASGLTALTIINCRSNILQSINVSGCTALSALYCWGNSPLTSLDVSGLTALELVSSSSNVNLASVDFSGCTLLEGVFFNGCSQLASVRAVGCRFGSSYVSPYYSYAADFTNCNLDLDAVWQLLTDLDVADDLNDRIILTSNPCDAGGGPSFNDAGQTHTAAEVLALMDAKDYDITLTGGTIAHA